MSTGILGTRAGLVADINLILQIAILIVLLMGCFQARRRNFSAHGRLMTAAVIANTIAIIAIMNPAFFRILPVAIRNPEAQRPTMLWPHAAIGALAELMGIYIVILMKLETSRPPRLRNIKWRMRITLLLWIVALAMGIALYFVRYV